MGRGIIESGLFRSERYGLEERTSDPATTYEGEAWIRTDLAPDTDQIATLRFDAGGSVWDIPIYDRTATTDGVSKAWSIQVGGVTGFIPLTTTSPAFNALKYQHNGSAYGAHDALTASAIPDSALDQNLLVWYRFASNSVTDTAASDEYANSTEENGTNSGATYLSNGGVTDPLDGGQTGAFEFNGSSAYLESSDAQAEISEPFSISVWANADSLASGEFVFAAYDNKLNIDYEYLDSNGFEFVIYDGSQNVIVSSGNATTGQWQHHVGTWDGSTMEYYINGTSQGTASVSSLDPGGTLYIGRYFNGGYFDGTIDDFRIYNTALSGSEVSDIYQQTQP